MFFQDHEKKVYGPNVRGCTTTYDPIRVDNMLTTASGGTVDQLLADAAPEDGNGDISESAVRERRVRRAEAETRLAELAREVFSLPPHPETTDGVALEYLYDYLEYMKGKGTRGGNTPQ